MSQQLTYLRYSGQEIRPILRLQQQEASPRSPDWLGDTEGGSRTGGL